MGKIIWKPATLLAPIPPVMVSCGSMEQPNIFTAAWTGIVNTSPAMTYLSIRPQRYSYELIARTGEFVINLTTRALVRAADFCGVRSGRDIDKFAHLQLTKLPASQVSAPLIAESPLHLECKVSQCIPLGSHEMFLANIVAVQVDDQYVDNKGQLHLERADLAAFAHGAYYGLDSCLGTFGFSVRKKPKAVAHRKPAAKNYKKREK